MCIKVSVIIPVYNVANYLSDCLDSVISQTLKEIEIICVNDASTDNSIDILRSYEKKDNRIIVIEHHINKGVSVARNTGVSKANGEYLYFLDGDDLLKVNALETLYNLSKKKRLEVVLFDGDSFYETFNLESKHKSFKTIYQRSKEYGYVLDGKELLKQMLINNDYRVNVWLSFFSKEFYAKANLSFKPNIIHEDNLFTFQCLLKASRIAHITDKLYLRRVRNNSIMTMPKSFEHAYGYFICGFEMLIMMNNLQLKYDEGQVISKVPFKMFNNARSIWQGLDEKELSKWENLSPFIKESFKYLVIDFLETKAIQREFRALENKLNLSEKELVNIKSGWSFRIGRIITFIPRHIRVFVKNILSS